MRKKNWPTLAYIIWMSNNVLPKYNSPKKIHEIIDYSIIRLKFSTDGHFCCEKGPFFRTKAKKTDGAMYERVKQHNMLICSDFLFIKKETWRQLVQPHMTNSPQKHDIK